MTEFVDVPREPDPNLLCVRDLRPGMVVPLNGKSVTVKAIGLVEPSMMIAGAGRKSAMAMQVEFEDHDPVIAHPADFVKRLNVS